MQQALRRHQEEPDGGSTPTVTAKEVIPASSPGLPLDDETRGLMESRFREMHLDPGGRRIDPERTRHELID